MSTTELQFSRSYDLPPAIVWDALVDQDLVEGWLAAAQIEAHNGGTYRLEWLSGARLAPVAGVITQVVQPTKLSIDTDTMGRLDFSLVAVPGGTRGLSTELRLSIEVDTEPRLLASTRALWEISFDQLESLLRGHPVDWSTWEQDRGDAWLEYLREAGEVE